MTYQTTDTILAWMADILQNERCIYAIIPTGEDYLFKLGGKVYAYNPKQAGGAASAFISVSSIAGHQIDPVTVPGVTMIMDDGQDPDRIMRLKGVSGDPYAFSEGSLDVLSVAPGSDHGFSEISLRYYETFDTLGRDFAVGDGTDYMYAGARGLPTADLYLSPNNTLADEDNITLNLGLTGPDTIVRAISANFSTGAMRMAVNTTNPDHATHAAVKHGAVSRFPGAFSQVTQLGVLDGTGAAYAQGVGPTFGFDVDMLSETWRVQAAEIITNLAAMPDTPISLV